MPANHTVSVGWQIVFTFLPIVNFWAFYRIRKLRKYLLYAYVPALVTSMVLLAIYYSQERFTPWGDQGLAFGDPLEISWLQIVGGIIGWGLQGFAVYLVIIWSRQHNRTFEPPA